MNWLLGLAFVLAAAEWTAEWHGKRRLEAALKPAVMLVLIAWVLGFAGIEGKLLWFVLGLAFSLLGDVFLLLPPERFFLPGLAAFLIAHLWYVAALWAFPLAPESVLPAVLLAVLILVVGVRVFRRLRQGLIDSDKAALLLPVGVYAAAISLMLFSAGYTLTSPDWSTAEAFPVAFGGLLFYISDIINAWLRFVAPVKNGRFWVMSSYHLGQIGLAVGVALHFAVI